MINNCPLCNGKPSQIELPFRTINCFGCGLNLNPHRSETKEELAERWNLLQPVNEAKVQAAYAELQDWKLRLRNVASSLSFHDVMLLWSANLGSELLDVANSLRLEGSD